MVLPLRDDNSDRRTTPFVNYALIAVNVFVFVFLQQLGTNERFTYSLACVPEEIVTGKPVEGPVRLRDPVTGTTMTLPLVPPPVPVYFTLLTSLFLHGGIMHLAGNMLFLWIFGDNIEDTVGHFRYLLFYLVCGVLASLAQVAGTYLVGALPVLPSRGASGAISGVLGAYLLLFPTRRVLALLFNFLTEVPAYVAIGTWFVFQIISALGVLGSGSQVGGVAYGARLGGFAAGLGLVKFFALGRQPTPDWDRTW